MGAKNHKPSRQLTAHKRNVGLRRKHATGLDTEAPRAQPRQKQKIGTTSAVTLNEPTRRATGALTPADMGLTPGALQ